MDRIELSDRLNRLSHDVIGCAIEVHRTLGPGLLESVYEAALCVEFEQMGVGYAQQVSVVGLYKGKPLPAQRIDLLVENVLIVELKAVQSVSDIHLAQLVSYLRVAEKPLGLLINFNESTIKKGTYRRINSKVAIKI